jgi:hypothetical protein
VTHPGRAPSDEKADKLRITDQFRSKNGFVYDIRWEGCRLTLFIAPREHPSDEGDWKIEARVRQDPEPFVLTQWGATRVDALQEMGRSWAQQVLEHHLPRFDWAAVEKALRDVRAV